MVLVYSVLLKAFYYRVVELNLLYINVFTDFGEPYLEGDLKCVKDSKLFWKSFT